MLAYALETMDRSPAVTRVVVVAREADHDEAQRLVAEAVPSKPYQVVSGGDSRHHSESFGMSAIRSDIEAGEISLVAIHDGARPFTTIQLLDRLIEAAMRHGGAIPGLPILEPMYQVTDGAVELMQPETVRRVQTPQVFRAAPLLMAFAAAAEAGFEGVDTAETVERFSDLDVVVVDGDPRNIKVTFAADFDTARGYALEWEEGSWL